MPNSALRSCLASLLLLCFATLAGADQTPWTRIDLPAGGQNPRGAVDAQGRVHLVWGKGKEAWYARWEGGKLGEPVRVNGNASVGAAGERGPQIAIGAEGVIGVVWQDRGTMHVTLSRDDGATWTPTEVRDAGAAGGIDCPTIGADAKGALYAVWIDSRQERPDKASADLFAAVLPPGGKAFGKNVQVNSGPLHVCSCCFPKVAADAQGKLYAAFRGEADDVREIALFVTADQGKSWRGGTVSSDQWRMNGCPMAGPALAVSPDGKSIALAWRTKERLRGAISRDGGKRFGPFDLAQGVGMQDYPFAALGTDGSGVLLWTAGGRWQGVRVGTKADTRKPLEPGVANAEASVLRGKDGQLLLLVAERP